MEKGKVEYRISMGMSVALIMLAALFDAFSMIPFIGGVFASIFWVIAGLYLWTKGVGFFGWKKLATVSISFIIELFPFVQTLPSLIAGIIAILLIIRIEDKTGAKVIQPLRKGVTPPRFERRPVNAEKGVRQPNRRMGDVEYKEVPPRNTKDEEISLVE